MKKIENKNWHTAGGIPIDFKAILAEIEEYVCSGGKIFVGTDSQIKGDVVVFASTICLHGNLSNRKYATYFFNKTHLDRSVNQELQKRIMQEVQLSIDLTMLLIERYPRAEVEIHVDVGTTNKSKTRKYVDMINGWLLGMGIGCKMKPDSWASSAVADHHTK
mgnify:CR=1 FL=1